MQRKHFASLSVFQLMAMFRRGIFYFFLSIYLYEFLGVSTTEMTLFATLPMITNIVAQSTLWGRISDKYKKRRLLIIFGELFAAIGYLVVFWIHNFVNKERVGVGHIGDVLFTQSELVLHFSSITIFDPSGIQSILRMSAYTIIIGFTIIEAGWSSSNLGWSALIADLTKDSERSRVMGLLQFIGGIGNVLGVTACGFLYQNGLGFWNGNLFYVSSGIMIFSMLALFMIPESYADLKSGVVEEQEIKTNEVSETTLRVRDNSKKIWPWKLFIWLILVLAVVNIGGNSIGQMIQIYVRLPNTFNSTAVIVAQLRNTSSIAMIIGGLAIGFLSSRFGEVKMLLVGFLLLLIGTISLPFAPHITIFFIYMALKGTSRVWIQTTSYSMVNRIVPLEKRGKMMGYYNSAFYLSWGLGGTIITGPIADSIVVDPANKIMIMFYTALFIIAIGIMIYMLARKYLKLNLKKKQVDVSVLISSIIGLAIVVIFSIKPISELILGIDNTVAYSYEITFYVASILVILGTLIYLLFRPNDFNHLSKEMTDKMKVG
ncbi:MAG: MFS transporter [Candidatus Heimdallarchaeota archaeon]|nr:MFS transporter [Candidatus Heimdallarchaeota archaeon]